MPHDPALATAPVSPPFPLSPAPAVLRRPARRHRLVLLNDPETVYAFAVAAIEAVFAVPRLDAERAVQHAHQHERSPLAEGLPEALAPSMDLLGRLAAHTGQTLRVVMEEVPADEVVLAAGFVPEVAVEKL